MSQGAGGIINPGRTNLNPCATETAALCSYKQETVGHILWAWPEEAGSEAWFGKNDAEQRLTRQER